MTEWCERYVKPSSYREKVLDPRYHWSWVIKFIFLRFWFLTNFDDFFIFWGGPDFQDFSEFLENFYPSPKSTFLRKVSQPPNPPFYTPPSKFALPTSLNRDFSGFQKFAPPGTRSDPPATPKFAFFEVARGPFFDDFFGFFQIGGVQKRSKNHQNFGPVPIVATLAPRRTWYNQLYTGCSTQETQCLLFFQNFF